MNTLIAIMLIALYGAPLFLLATVVTGVLVKLMDGSSKAGRWLAEFFDWQRLD